MPSAGQSNWGIERPARSGSHDPVARRPVCTSLGVAAVSRSPYRDSDGRREIARSADPLEEATAAPVGVHYATLKPLGGKRSVCATFGSAH